MSKLSFTEDAWNDYFFWQAQNKKVLKKINRLLQDVERNRYTGIGKPEALKNNLYGYWSRRIDDEHRLVYKIIDDVIEIYQCKGHY